MPVSGDDFRNLVRRARYREAPSSGSMAGDPGPPQSIAQTGKMGAWADEQGRFSDHATAHSKHRIATAPFQRGVHRTGPSCVSFEETQARTALRQAALPSFHVSFRSADIESAPH
jgi:hypothetical protein